MPHERRSTIVALLFPIPGSTLSPGIMAWYWWTQNRSAEVRPGDYCRINRRDTQQLTLF